MFSTMLSARFFFFFFSFLKNCEKVSGNSLGIKNVVQESSERAGQGTLSHGGDKGSRKKRDGSGV